MDVYRRFVTEAPDIQTFRDAKPTLLVSWWCTAYALAIIFLRFCGRYIRAEKVFFEDAIMVWAIVPLLIRMTFVHVVLVYGTNNTKTDGLSQASLHDREIGSQMVLISRVFYAAYLWAIKLSTSMFLRTLTEAVWKRYHQRMLLYLHVFLGATFAATVVSDLGACQPFSHYWQVAPDPGAQCRQGYAHLMTSGALNIVTNLTLIIFPIPMILKSRLPQAQKISILLRLSLPILSITLSLYQIPRVIDSRGQQALRSLFASLEILLATFTSNALVLASLLQDRGYKKSRYRAPPPPSTRNASVKYTNTNTNTNTPGAGGGGSGRRSGPRGSDEDFNRWISEGKEAAGAVAMEVLPSSRSVRKTSVSVLEELPEAHLQQIRVEETWQITVEDEAKSRGG